MKTAFFCVLARSSSAAVTLGCDMLLRYIFAKIGAVSRRAVEICSGDGYENNVANLAVLHGWEVIMMDGRENNMAHARRFYTQKDMPPSMKTPHLIRDFITRANVNQLISSKGFSGEIDLFSLDMDGVDWCSANAPPSLHAVRVMLRAQVDMACAARGAAARGHR